jgi:hypothetical protein
MDAVVVVDDDNNNNNSIICLLTCQINSPKANYQFGTRKKLINANIQDSKEN